MNDLPQHAVATVSGPAWEPLRRQFFEIGQILLAASFEAHCQSLPHYVKFTVDAWPDSPAYAVVWLKNSKRLIVGLCLAEQHAALEFESPPAGTTYRGLTKYFVVERGAAVPRGLAKWARLAYRRAGMTAAETAHRRVAS